MLLIKLNIIFLTFLSLSETSFSEIDDTTKKEYPKIGSVLTVSYNFSYSDIRILPSIRDSIQRYAFGENYGMIMGVYYEHPFNYKYALMFQGLYSVHFADIYTNLSSKKIFNNITYDVISRHKVSTDLTSILFEPLLKVLLVEKLSFLGGFNIGLRFEKIVEHEETILKPENLTFPDGSKTRIVDDRLVPIDGFRAGLVGGFVYDIPIDVNEKFIVSPVVLFSYGYSDVANNFSWDVNSFRAGLILKYVPLSQKKIVPKPDYQIEEIEMIDTIRIRSNKPVVQDFKSGKMINYKDTITVGNTRKISSVTFRVDTLFVFEKESKINRQRDSIYVLATSEISGKNPISEIRIEDFLSTSIQPLLNYLFFYENSDEIPARYNLIKPEQEARFDFKELHNKPTLEVYSNILNILAKRLKETPKAKITITGCNAGKEYESPEISEKRAKAVADYLINIWGIESKRITLKYRNLPSKYSTLNDTDGIAENRRVEITSDNFDILSPLILRDTLRIVTPLFIKFNINSKLMKEIKEWKVKIFNNHKIIKEYTGYGILPELIDWDLNERQDVIYDLRNGFYFQVEAINSDDEKIISNREKIQVDHITVSKKILNQEGDRRIDRYSLILFEFNTASLTPTNSRIMNFINTNIYENSSVLVEGFTDRVGDESYNLELSKRRASSVSQLIKAKNKSNIGYGETNLLFDNNLPEGRFYCRTVRIIVETPLNNGFLK